jgi:hypothetical protein
LLLLVYRMSPGGPTVVVHTQFQSATMVDMVRQMVLAGLLMFGVTLAVSVTADAQQGAKPPSTAAPMRPAPPGALPPLPRVFFEPVRPMPIVQQVYEFAARHPEVLGYIPCYCGCETRGHNGNHDCFVKSRAANGRITEWEAHGMGCAVCLDVGREAMTLFNQGLSVSAIRTAIDKKYSGHFPSRTPTPQPPKAGAKS